MNVLHESEEILVEVEEILEPIIPEFLEKRHLECVMLEQMLEAGNFEEIQKVAHKIKGTGGSYGFDRMSEIGEALENAAIAESASRAQVEIRNFKDYLKRVTVRYV